MVLAQDLIAVLRIEYGKARDGGGMGGSAGVYQQGYGTYAPAGQDPYAGYYVSWSLTPTNGNAESSDAGSSKTATVHPGRAHRHQPRPLREQRRRRRGRTHTSNMRRIGLHTDTT